MSNFSKNHSLQLVNEKMATFTLVSMYLKKTVVTIRNLCDRMETISYKTYQTPFAEFATLIFAQRWVVNCSYYCSYLFMLQYV